MEKRHEQAIRNWCDVLKLWRLCGSTRCRRTHRCRGNVRLCARTNYKLLPKGVRDWFVMMLAGCSAKLSLEEIMAETQGYAEHAAYADWCRQVHISLRK